MVSASVKEEPGASLKVKLIVALLCARFTSVLSVVTETVGVTVSTVTISVAVGDGLPALSATFAVTVKTPSLSARASLALTLTDHVSFGCTVPRIGLAVHGDKDGLADNVRAINRRVRYCAADCAPPPPRRPC